MMPWPAMSGAVPGADSKYVQSSPSARSSRFACLHIEPYASVYTGSRGFAPDGHRNQRVRKMMWTPSDDVRCCRSEPVAAGPIRQHGRHGAARCCAHPLEERFEKLRSTLVADHPGQWALLIDRGSRLVPLLQVLDDEWDAIRAGYADPAARRFCVKPILEADPELMVNSLGARH